MAKRGRRQRRSKAQVASTTERSTRRKQKRPTESSKGRKRRKVAKSRRRSKPASRLSVSEGSSSPSSHLSSETSVSRSKPRKSQRTERPECSEFVFRFNLSMDPWLEYSFRLVADKGCVEENWTSHRLKEEVIFLETSSDRFQLSLSKQATKPVQIFQKYTWAKVKNTQSMDTAAMIKAGLPLDQKHTEVIYDGVDWNEIQWGKKSVQVRSKVYKVQCIFFAERTGKNAE